MKQKKGNEKAMFCPYCGRMIPKDSLFCPVCGKELLKKSGKSDRKRWIDIVITGIIFIILVGCILLYLNQQKRKSNQTEGKVITEENILENKKEPENKIGNSEKNHIKQKQPTQEENEESDAEQSSIENNSESNKSEEHDNVPAISTENIQTVTATSNLYEAAYDIDDIPENVLDGNLETAWVEGVTGDGIGEALMFEFDSEYIVSGINIFNGFQKSSSLYYKNSRPEIIKISFSDGSEKEISLEDTMGVQILTFESGVKTQFVKIEIESVYKGSTYEDTCISDISFF